MKKRAKSIYPKRGWTDADKVFLRQHYNTMPMPDIMKHLCRTDTAIHAMAARLHITGDRYNVNNYQTGSSYKKVGRTVIPQQKAKQSKPQPAIIGILGRKKKPKRRRWCDQKMNTKPFNSEGKILLRIDHRTAIYIPVSATKQEIDSIILRYKKVP